MCPALERCPPLFRCSAFCSRQITDLQQGGLPVPLTGHDSSHTEIHPHSLALPSVTHCSCSLFFCFVFYFTVPRCSSLPFSSRSASVVEVTSVLPSSCLFKSGSVRVISALLLIKVGQLVLEFYVFCSLFFFFLLSFYFLTKSLTKTHP